MRRWAVFDEHGVQTIVCNADEAQAEIDELRRQVAAADAHTRIWMRCARRWKELVDEHRRIIAGKL